MQLSFGFVLIYLNKTHRTTDHVCIFCRLHWGAHVCVLCVILFIFHKDGFGFVVKSGKEKQINKESAAQTYFLVRASVSSIFFTQCEMQYVQLH